MRAVTGKTIRLDGMNAEEKLYKETRKRQNELNRRRARAMEQRVAKELGGHRVPMSGSGSLKGDGMINSDIGLYLIECKYTAQTFNQEGGSLRFEYRWVTKFDNEILAMRAFFGVFVIHYHNRPGDYVIMRDVTYRRIRGPSVEMPVEAFQSDRSGFNLTERKIAQGIALSASESAPVSAVGIFSIMTPVGVLLVMHKDLFMRLLEEAAQHG